MNADMKALEKNAMREKCELPDEKDHLDTYGCSPSNTMSMDP